MNDNEKRVWTRAKYYDKDYQAKAMKWWRSLSYNEQDNLRKKYYPDILILVLSAAGYAEGIPVDKKIREDWSKGKIQEIGGKKVLTPALIYVFIDADGSETVVTETVWTEKYFKN